MENSLVDETTPLVSPPHSRSLTTAISIKWNKAYLIFPSLFLSFLGTTLTSTTTIEFVRIVACRLWYSVHDEDLALYSGSLDDRCRAAGPEKYFSSFITANALLMAVCGFISSSVIATMANRLGRKPVYITLGLIDLVGTVGFIISATSSNRFADYGLIASIVLSDFAGPYLGLLLANMMIVDSVDPSQRTFFLSLLSGVAYAGAAPAYTIGGLITKRYQAIPCFNIAITIMCINTLFSIFFLHETLGDRSISEAQHPDRQPEQDTRRIVSAMTRVFQPLKQFLPRKNISTGRWNLRLFLLGVGMLIYISFVGYIGEMMLIYGSTIFNWGPAEVGMLLSILLFSRVFTLILIFPTIIRLFQPFYARHYVPSPSIECGSEEENLHELEEDTSSHLDVHVVAASWVIEGIVVVGLGLITNSNSFLAAAGLLGASSGWSPAFNSVIVASVDPLHVSMVLSGVEMITSIAKLVSPLLLGTVLTSTLHKLPSLTFFISGAGIAFASVILFFVKDSDRHTPA